MNGFPEEPVGRVMVVADEGAELFDKSFSYIFVKDEGFGGKGYRLIGRDFGTFAVK